jgi:ADP-ribosylation factor 2-binding protein
MLQDIVMSEEFTDLQREFFSRYCEHFTPDEENKLIYMEIFNEYLNKIEKYIEKSLGGTDMQEFARMLTERQDEIDGPIFDLLLSFSDFGTFKEMMLNYKSEGVLSIEGQASVIHIDEMEEGEERPDLEGISGFSR